MDMSCSKRIPHCKKQMHRIYLLWLLRALCLGLILSLWSTSGSSPSEVVEALQQWNDIDSSCDLHERDPRVEEFPPPGPLDSEIKIVSVFQGELKCMERGTESISRETDFEQLLEASDSHEKSRENISTNENIFVQIAAYRDPQLLPTIKDLLEKAKYPENLRIGISWQHSPQDKWDKLDDYLTDARFRILDIPSDDSRGVCWARNQVQSLYKHEKYTLQLDSHHRFAQDWDVHLIQMLQDLQEKGHEKPLITSYIPSFDPDEDPKERIQQPWKMNFDRFIPEGAVFFLPAEFDSWEDTHQPLPGRFYSAHFAFTVGKFCLEVPHDPHYYFHGEEISIAVRAFTHGYDIFHPHKVLIWHEYTRKGRTKHWDDNTEWFKQNNESHLRNRKLFEMDGEINDIDFGVYGFGNVRTLKEYELYSGLCFKKRAITQRVLDNKPPPDPVTSLLSYEEFQTHLIGIFKYCIDIEFEQVRENDYDFWAVVFKDENGADIYREDADTDEILRMANNSNGYIQLWREFKSDRKPSSWIVWPHSISKGWMDSLTGYL